jgi:hypothetical protein
MSFKRSRQPLPKGLAGTRRPITSYANEAGFLPESRDGIILTNAGEKPVRRSPCQPIGPVPFVPFSAPVEGADERREIAVVAEEPPLSGRAVEHVVEESSRRSPALPWHDGTCYPPCTPSVNLLDASRFPPPSRFPPRFPPVHPQRQFIGRVPFSSLAIRHRECGPSSGRIPDSNPTAKAE